MDLCLFAGTALVARYDSLRRSSSSSNKTTTNKSSFLTLDLLKQQNARTSSAIIEHYNNSNNSNNNDSKTANLFAKLAQYEGDLTIQRDTEDASKLQLGIEFAQDKGVIDPKFVPEPYVHVDVLGKTPEQVANLILDKVAAADAGGSADNSSSSNKTSSSVIVIVGLSGTGKGTTVAQLRKKLQEQGQQVTCWSNGNIFRAVTLLAATWCEQTKTSTIQDALTKDNIASFMNMLSFEEKSPGHYDTHIQGLSFHNHWVGDIQNTLLKSPAVSQNIPTVAQYIQGEVIQFAAQAVEILHAANISVLLEGREQTVNYVRTPHRFVLTLSDESLIGKRRAAQRLMAEGLHACMEKNGDASTDKQEDVESVLDAALARMVAEIV